MKFIYIVMVFLCLCSCDSEITRTTGNSSPSKDRAILLHEVSGGDAKKVNTVIHVLSGDKGLLAQIALPGIHNISDVKYEWDQPEGTVVVKNDSVTDESWQFTYDFKTSKFEFMTNNKNTFGVKMDPNLTHSSYMDQMIRQSLQGLTGNKEK